MPSAGPDGKTATVSDLREPSSRLGSGRLPGSAAPQEGMPGLLWAFDRNAMAWWGAEPVEPVEPVAPARVAVVPVVPVLSTASHLGEEGHDLERFPNIVP